jgi:hypothetical protein
VISLPTEQRLYFITQKRKITSHSAAPSKCIHSSNPKSHMDKTGTNRQNITDIQPAQAGSLQQPILICGHTHASPEPHPTGRCKHSQKCTVHPPTQPNAELTQNACNEGCPTNPARASCFVSQRTQEFHASLSARNSPQRRAQRGSRLARLVHTWLGSGVHTEQQQPQT